MLLTVHIYRAQRMSVPHAYMHDSAAVLRDAYSSALRHSRGLPRRAAPKIAPKNSAPRPIAAQPMASHLVVPTATPYGPPCTMATRAMWPPYPSCGTHVLWPHA